MVYEELPIVTRRHDVPLRDRQHRPMLVNTTVAGTLVLATSRKVNQEAAYIPASRLRKTLQAPPKVIIETEHLIGMIRLHDCVSPSRQNTVLDRIIQAVSTRKSAVHEYRKGKI